MSNLTILRPPAPKYKINETVYPIASSKRGYLESLMICDVSFDPTCGRYLYSFRKDTRDPIDERNILPIRLYETEITTICEALLAQIDSLLHDYEAAVKLYDEACPTGVLAYTKRGPITDKFGRIQPPPPRFGFNETVYLIDSAMSVGRLEAYRIASFKYDITRSEWMYLIDIQPRLERNMTVGDRDDMRHPSVMQYYESELGVFCEAQSEVVKFLTMAVNRAQTRRQQLCPDLTGRV